jgi:peptidoglycan/LPS O-acetylase OafA/YrhL
VHLSPEASVEGPDRSLRAWCLRHIARPYPAQEFVPQIDGLRFVAIMAVVLYHVQGFLSTRLGASSDLWHRVLGEGAFGVPLFFSISGYILCRPFLGGREVSLRRYFVRRLTRLEPPYIINLLIVFALKIAVLGLAASELLPHLLASLVYLHNIAYGEHSLVNGVAWSLEVEWQFYVLAPLLFLLVAKSRPLRRMLGLLSAIAVGGWLFSAGEGFDPRIALSVVRYAGFFFAGVWIAVLDEEHPDWGRGRWEMDLVGIGAAVAIVAILLEAPVAAPLLPLLTALLLLAGIRGRMLALILGWWPVYCIGAMCYTIYLYHFFVISMLGRILGPILPATPGWALLGFGSVSIVVVIALCLFPYLLIERPFMLWRPGTNRLSDAIGGGIG